MLKHLKGIETLHSKFAARVGYLDPPLGCRRRLFVRDDHPSASHCVRDDPGVRDPEKLIDGSLLMAAHCPRGDPLIAGDDARVGSNEVLLIQLRPCLERIILARAVQFVVHRLDTHGVARVEELNQEIPVPGCQIKRIVCVRRINEDVRVQDIHRSHHLEVFRQLVEHVPLVGADHTEALRESRTPLQGGCDDRGRK